MAIAENVQSVHMQDGSIKYTVARLDNLEPKRAYCFFKRMFDLILSLLAGALLLLPMLIIALIVVCTSKGPALYKQERTGKNGKTFTLYKFRSMRIDAEAEGAQWAVVNDPRVTKFGKIMRMSRLDELPQLINIIKGDMSIVGPRPERPVFYEKFAEYIDGFDERLKVTPGLTGYAQINGGYDLKPEEKIAYDIEYIKNRSLLLDLKVIFGTIAVVFSHDGAK